MRLEKRINAFTELGKFLGQFQQDGVTKNNQVAQKEAFLEAFEMQIHRAHEFNGWFTKENIIYAFNSWSNSLNINNLTKWTSNYTLNSVNPRNIAIIMAGNIPLVGFHDFLSVLISGHSVVVKQSSNDKYFLPLIAKYLEFIEPEFKGKILFTEDKLQDFDAVIATGSNNTARYFDYYFGKYPNIIRKNRNSVAILTGNESKEELTALGEDIFRYFGLGCRSVSKLFVPEGYNFDNFFGAIYNHHPIIEIKKYENNYDYNKAVFLMSQFKLLENGFLMLKEDTSYSSPIAALFYENYTDEVSLQQKLATDSELVQCVVGRNEKFIDFGKTQQPELWDYADGVDTLEFLQSFH